MSAGSRNGGQGGGAFPGRFLVLFLTARRRKPGAVRCSPRAGRVGDHGHAESATCTLKGVRYLWHAVANGSASTVKGISGLVPFSPACIGGFRPTGFLSTLRPGGYPPRRKTRFWPRGASPRRRWDSPPPLHRRGSPTGKRRLCPAHATSPNPLLDSRTRCGMAAQARKGTLD